MMRLFDEPGKFTTFAGYEWSQFRGRAHLHRNIIFRDMMLPDYPLSSFELKHEEALWTWMRAPRPWPSPIIQTWPMAVPFQIGMRMEIP